MIACKTWQSFVFGVVARRFDVAEVRWWCLFTIKVKQNARTNFFCIICRKKQISKPLQA